MEAKTGSEGLGRVLVIGQPHKHESDPKSPQRKHVVLHAWGLISGREYKDDHEAH